MKKKLNSSRALTRNIAAMLQLASASDIMEGIEWYARAGRLGQQLANKYGCTLEQSVGVIAALSPNNKWRRNCQDAESCIKAWSLGWDVLEVVCCTYPLMKEKAHRILSLNAPSKEAVAEILNGRKISAFALSILGEQSAVCVDGHAFAIWVGERITTTKTPSIGKKLYERIARDYCNVAMRSVAMTGHQLTAAQVQAVTWVCYRRLMGIK
tara:strand:- start:555 stop:1187 length:633 start_codon:yes stop_codon:yes gene_type:complete